MSGLYRHSVCKTWRSLGSQLGSGSGLDLRADEREIWGPRDDGSVGEGMLDFLSSWKPLEMSNQAVRGGPVILKGY